MLTWRGARGCSAFFRQTPSLALPHTTRRGTTTEVPLDGGLHSPPGASHRDGAGVAGETWSQRAAKNRFTRSRRRTVDIASIPSYEYAQLKKMCKKRPTHRQWAVRDEMCRLDPGIVHMSPSMESAFMRVYRSKDKAAVRAALRDIVPVLEYRHKEVKQALLKRDDPSKLIPEDQPDTLNQLKRELYERTELTSAGETLRLADPRHNNQLRWKIRMRLIRFQRKMAVNSAVSSRTVLYNEADSLGYFLFRGPPMYAALHRVFFELTRMLPHFVPKTMLDFGAGTGTAMMVAKETYDPSSLAFPLYRNARVHFNSSPASRMWSLQSLRYDLKRLKVENEEVKKARFLAVSALIQNGEVELNDIPADLRKELVDVAKAAAHAAAERRRLEFVARRRAEVVSADEWDTDTTGEATASVEDPDDVLPGEMDTQEMEGEGGSAPGTRRKVSWWETFVDDETASLEEKAQKRLQPLQEIIAVEPAPAMMETALTVLHHDVQNVKWRRFLMPEDETQQHDLVVAAYTLSEIAHPKTRMETVKKLWKMTRGVLILVEYASLSNFDMLMQMRDKILEEKDFGLWDFKPTIIGPCPHEKECPMRFSALGVKRRKLRVCHTSVRWKPTFVERWIRQVPGKVAEEPACYMIFARNELVPERAERRKRELAAEEARKKRERDAKQRELYEASLRVTDTVHERLSDEALHRPHTELPPPATAPAPEASGGVVVGAKGESALVAKEDFLSDQAHLQLPRTGDAPRNVAVGSETFHRLVFPRYLPPATHKFNRLPFVDSNYQSQRAISPGEMLVVRGEVDDLRATVLERAPKYMRIVRRPRCRGAIHCELCTPEGDLLKGRVYRRYVGDGISQHNRARTRATALWQRIGGWKMAKAARPLQLFPDDVPLYSVRKVPRIPYPNTLMGLDGSTIDKTGMMHGVPLDPDAVPTTDEEAKEIGKAQVARTKDEVGDRFLEGLLGTKIATPDEVRANIDSRTELSTQDWARAVRKAKQKVSKYVAAQGEAHSKRKRNMARYPMRRQLRVPNVHTKVQGRVGSLHKTPRSLRPQTPQMKI